MVAGGFALGLALNESGLAENVIKSIPFGNWSPVAILLASGVICYILSNFISNTATAALLVPILAVVCKGMGGALDSIGGTPTVLIGIAIAKDWLRHPFAQWSMAVVMAGAFGNFIDRAFIGYVTDMVDTLFMNFAVYNFADICVVLGILALAIYIIFFYEKCEGKKAHGHSDDQG